MQEILHIINEMSPYLLLGFLIAGLLHVFLPTRYYHKYLSKPTFGSVINAAIFGIPLPLCSCGVIPTAMSLRKEGASKGAVTSFLISTPQTGVDSILATFGMMGLPFALVRPIAAMTTALFGGAAANLFDPDKSIPSAHVHCCCNEEEKGNKLERVLRYAYVEMFGDIAKRLVIGLLLAGVITILVPDHFFEIFAGNTLASMLLVLCIAIPMYICATGSIPIAVALMMNGLTPGSALVLLMAGPACNIASILVVKQVLGTRSLVIYIASIVLGAVGFGCLIDYLQFGGYVDFLGQLTMGSAGCCHEVDAWWQWASSGVLAILLLNVVLRRHHNHHNHENETNENTMTYTIKGMNCNHCRMTAENALKEVEGVTSATVVLETGEAQVEGTATEEALRQAVEKVGFKLIANK